MCLKNVNATKHITALHRLSSYPIYPPCKASAACYPQPTIRTCPTRMGIAGLRLILPLYLSCKASVQYIQYIPYMPYRVNRAKRGWSLLRGDVSQPTYLGYTRFWFKDTMLTIRVILFILLIYTSKRTFSPYGTYPNTSWPAMRIINNKFLLQALSLPKEYKHARKGGEEKREHTYKQKTLFPRKYCI